MSHFWELKGLIPVKENITIWALYTSPLSLPFPIQEREFGRLSVSALLRTGSSGLWKSTGTQAYTQKSKPRLNIVIYISRLYPCHDFWWVPTQFMFRLLMITLIRSNKLTTYVYLRIPSNFDVQIITLLSAPPDANLFPVTMKQKCYDVFQDNSYQQ